MTVIDESEYLAHYGILRRSGRYPWGSGSTQNIRNKTFLDIYAEFKRNGGSDVEFCRAHDMSTTQLRAVKSIAKNQQKAALIAQAEKLAAKQMSNVAAAAKMGIPESTYRALLAPGVKERNEALVATANLLKQQVAEKKYLDVGSGVETHLDISEQKLHNAVTMLKEEGYLVHPLKTPQIGTGEKTDRKVLVPPGVTQREVFLNQDKIRQIVEFSSDGGKTLEKFHPPIAVHPDRVQVRYADQGGEEADGVIYVRPGVDDLSLGGKQYAQVRVKVGENNFLKGMAMYKDDLPDGVDLLFNTNKTSTGNKLDAMKKIEPDPELPFGSVVRQIVDNRNTPNERLVSAMNIVNEQGDWSKWSKTLSSQMLSKQSPELAKGQLDMTFDRRQKEFDEINSLTNPTVKKKLLETFAESTDSAAVHLKAAELPRQANHVILPINSIPPSQIYAPTYNDGESVVLIRFPHGGRFEIPELTVNNKHREAKKLLGNAEDAIGIHHTVAERLSGADFDGDSVLVIPNDSGLVKTSPALEKLKGFNPKIEYKGYEGMPVLTSTHKQHLMGDVSNLITDMTLRGAPNEHLVRAVRHSMVVIDAENHKLDYKRSAVEHGIADLKAEYQGEGKANPKRAGASTIISRKKSTVFLPEMKRRPQREGGPTDKSTGRKIFVETGRTKRGPNGERTLVLRKQNRLAITEDAHTLSSGTPMEKLYADHSNKLKNLANKARLEALRTPSLQRSPSATKHYAKEVASLNAKLALVKMNRPRERQAQDIANAVIKLRKDANPNLEKDTLKKIKFQELTKARIRTGAQRHDIVIEQDEWNAIQAGAISNHMLSQILAKADLDRVRELATPRSATKMTTTDARRAVAMLASGYTRAEVASRFGVSPSTLQRSISDQEGG